MHMLWIERQKYILMPWKRNIRNCTINDAVQKKTCPLRWRRAVRNFLLPLILFMTTVLPAPSNAVTESVPPLDTYMLYIAFPYTSCLGCLNGQRLPYYQALCPLTYIPSAITKGSAGWFCGSVFTQGNLGSFSWEIVSNGTATCPIAIPAYTFNLSTGMCERTVPTPCLPPNVLNLATGQCEPPKTYTVTLTPDKPTIEPSGTTAGEGNSSTTLTVTVIDQSTQQGPTEPVQVKLIAHKPSDGGHDHDDPSRPRGWLNGTECTTDEPCTTLTFSGGIATQTVSYKAPSVSGKHSFSASCDQCGNSPQTANLVVKVDGLEPIPTSSFYVFGSSSRHGTKNHYLMPEAAEKLLLLAINYQSQRQFKVMNPNTNTMAWPDPLRVNDASLEWGGRFDIFGDWTKPHKEHMRGVSVDLRANEGTPNAIPPENFQKFEMLLDSVITKGKEKFILECTGDEEDGPQHNRVAENNCVSVLDGSFDNNRHYHIRLMGVK